MIQYLFICGILLLIIKYDKSLLALTFAYNNLKLNTNILSEKIVEMETVDTSKYAPDLVDAFVESIENLKNLLHNPSTITISDIKTAISPLVEKSSENTDSSNADNSTEETKDQEENSLTSNPYTGDIILIITGILILASIILAVTTIYLKKNKNK